MDDVKVQPEEAHLLLIEDDEMFREDLTQQLRESGYRVRTAENGELGIEAIREETPDLVLSDLKMPKTSGMDVLDWIQEQQLNIPLILITAYGKRENALEAVQKGAFGYIQKPFKIMELEFKIQKALTHHFLARKNEIMERTRPSEDHKIVWGESDVMQELREKVQKVAASESTVLVRGESGTGKELVARELHRQSQRSKHPFIAVNCAALSAGLLESELFGHEKGAFTGADRERTGRFELADHGSILLDEISEIDVDLQAKILRVLEEKSFERVGSSQTRTVDVRVIATSNRNLEEEVKNENFRKDLFYRLNVVPVEVPPLRERKEDIPVLAEHFQKVFSRRRGVEPDAISDDTIDLLQSYNWPGNVRELKNIVERCLVLNGNGRLEFDRIENWLAGQDLEGRSEPSRLAGVELKELEKKAVVATLEKNDGHRKNTAEELGISVRTLRNRINDWDLEI